MQHPVDTLTPKQPPGSLQNYCNLQDKRGYHALHCFSIPPLFGPVHMCAGMVRQTRQDPNSLVELSGGRDSWGELIVMTLGKIPSSGLRFASGQRSTHALESKTPVTINHWTEPGRRSYPDFLELNVIRRQSCTCNIKNRPRTLPSM